MSCGNGSSAPSPHRRAFAAQSYNVAAGIRGHFGHFGQLFFARSKSRFFASTGLSFLRAATYLLLLAFLLGVLRGELCSHGAGNRERLERYGHIYFMLAEEETLPWPSALGSWEQQAAS